MPCNSIFNCSTQENHINRLTKFVYIGKISQISKSIHSTSFYKHSLYTKINVGVSKLRFWHIFFVFRYQQKKGSSRSESFRFLTYRLGDYLRRAKRARRSVAPMMAVTISPSQPNAVMPKRLNSQPPNRPPTSPRIRFMMQPLPLPFCSRLAI